MKKDERMKHALIEAGLPEPDISITGFYTIKFSNSSKITREETRKETGEETREEIETTILIMMREHPDVTANELARRTGLTRKGIEYHIRKLKVKGKIIRVGSTKSGQWELSKNSVDGMAGGLVERLADGLVETWVEGLVDTQKQIIDIIRELPRVSKQEMADRIGISTTAIDKNIDRLKELGLVKHVGPAKGGHWEVVGE